MPLDAVRTRPLSPWRVLRRLLRTGVRWGRVTFFRREISSDLAPEPIDAEIRVEEANPADLSWLLSGANPSQKASHLFERFARGDRCFVGVARDGQPVHVRWVTTTVGYIPEIERDLRLALDEAYCYDAYTRPEARRHGVDGLVRLGVFRVLAAEGIARVWSYARSDNPPGLRAAGRWQRPEGTLSYFGVRGLRPLCWRSAAGTIPPLVPHRPAAFRRPSRTVLSPPPDIQGRSRGPARPDEPSGRAPGEDMHAD